MGILRYLKRLWPGVVDREIEARVHQCVVKFSNMKATEAEQAYKQGYWDGARDQKQKTMSNLIREVTENPSKN